MMRWIVSSSVQFRLLVVALAVVVMGLGFTQLRDAPMDVLPEFNAPYVEVQTEALGLSAAEVEQLITVPMEADLLNGVAWLKTIRSESMPGLSSVVLIFEPGTDIMRARQVVQERLTQAHGLPNVSKAPAMLQPVSSTSRILNVGLSSDELSLIDMSVLARWTMKPRLMGVPGVAHVSIWGQRKRQLQVQVDPEKLRAENLTLHDIVKTAGDALWVSPLSFLNASYPGTGGFIDTPNQRLSIRHVLPISSPEELAEVAVSGRKNMVLGDVATVVENHQPLIGDALVDDGTGLLLVIEKFPWANTVEVTEGVEAALAALAPGLTGMEIDTQIFRPATYVENAYGNFKRSWLIGLAIAAVALVFLVMDVRVALVSMIAIPLSVTAAALVLYFREGSFDTMILAGLVIALGVIVDDAVGDVRNIAHRLRKHRASGGQNSVAKVIVDGSLETRSVLVFAALILLLVAVPASLLFGVAGAVGKTIAFSYALAILVSMLVAMTVTPALAMYMFSKSGPGEDSPVIRGLSRMSDGLVSQAVRAPVGAIAAILVLIGAGAAVLPTLQRDSVIPTLKETDILIRAESAPGTSHPAMARLVAKASDELRVIPGVLNVGAHTGRAVMSEEVVNVNASEIWVSIDPTADYDATIDAISEVIEGYPGLHRELLTYSDESVFEALRGTDRNLVIRVYGEDQETLLQEAHKVRDAMASVEGVVAPEVEMPVVEPIIQIEADLEACERHGIKPGDIRRASAILLGGIEVGMLFEEQKVFDVVVWGTPNTRHSVTDVRELLIDTPTGGHVRLEEIADVRVVPAPTVINREGVNRRIDVVASVAGRSVAAVAGDVDQQLRRLSFPLEFHAEVLGETEERQIAASRVRNLAIACGIVALLLLQAAFGSWRLGTAAFIAIPMALSGGLLAARLTGGVFSIGSLIGLVTVLGIALRGTITTIHQYQRAEKNGDRFGADLVQSVTRERFGSIFTTTVVAGLAVLPIVFSGSIAGQEILHPMAVVILGGLVTSLLLNLYVVPAIYIQFGRGAAPEWAIATDEEEEVSSEVRLAEG
ncbi:MAG: efflux RND transporter permease subunit [Candidatus Latescibacterota bacterium]|nr:MAG: efflux RND transporter permease subunit [Candidatus Latescibacterota bacterium]